MPWNDGLSGVALNIAQTTRSPLRVMAGPGTGKTFAMKRRVARLLEEGVNPKRILVVTLTRTAAQSLVAELRALGLAGCENIWAGTLHGFCYSLLAKNSVFQYLGRTPRPLITITKSKVLQFEAAPLVQDLCANKSYGSKRECTKRIKAFEAAWSRLQSDDPGWPQDSIDRQFHEDLIDWLRFHESMLIGELVPEALRFLRDNPAAPELKAFDHVIVDEYQDLNKAEQVMIDILATNATCSIVGDVDQSIYQFRHAHPEGITEFAVSHPNTHDETLDECRRCPTQVVAMANHLIRQNHLANSIARLNPFKTNSVGQTHIIQWDSLSQEADGLANYILYLVNKKGYQPRDILILCPRRLIGYDIRDQLVGLSIPVHSFYHEEALEPDEAQLAFTALTLLANPNDRVALRYWLGHGSSSWRERGYRELRSVRAVGAGTGEAEEGGGVVMIRHFLQLTFVGIW